MPGDCNPLAAHFQDLVDAGLGGVSPHVALSPFMPPSFVALTPNNRGAEAWQPTTLARYNDYAKALVRFIATRAFDNGAPSVVFEISNELDIADSEPEHFVSKPNGGPTDPSALSLKPVGTWGRWLWWIDSNTFDVHQWGINGPNQAVAYPYPATGLAYPYRADPRRMDRQLSPLHKIFSDAVKC